MASIIESRSAQDISETPPNTVALIGVVLAGVSSALCLLLFSMADQMPDNVTEFQQLETGTPGQLRLLILGCSTAVLTLVAFILCLIGLVIPDRRRVLACLGTCLSGCILLGVFGTLLIGAWMNPPLRDTELNDSSISPSVNEPSINPSSISSSPAKKSATAAPPL